VERDAGPDRDLVAEDERGEEIASVAAAFRVRDGKQRRQHGDAGVALGERVPVMGVEGVDRRGAGEGGAGRARAAAVEENAPAAGPCPCGARHGPRTMRERSVSTPLAATPTRSSTQRFACATTGAASR
jgi:hypothetical protein